MSLSDSVPLSSVKPSGPGRAYERYTYNSQPKSFNLSALDVHQHVSVADSFPTTELTTHGTAYRSRMSRNTSLPCLRQTL
jgi:hypothetical protein